MHPGIGIAFRVVFAWKHAIYLHNAHLDHDGNEDDGGRSCYSDDDSDEDDDDGDEESDGVGSDDEFRDCYQDCQDDEDCSDCDGIGNAGYDEDGSCGTDDFVCDGDVVTILLTILHSLWCYGAATPSYLILNIHRSCYGMLKYSNLLFQLSCLRLLL